MKDLLKQFYKQNSSAKAISLSAESKQKIKANLMANLNEPKIILVEKQNTGFSWVSIRSFLFKTYVTVPLVLLFLVAGSAVASANALPGDTLYPLKRGVETVSVIIAPTQDAKTDLRVYYAKKRIAELDALKKLGAIANNSTSDNSTSDQSQINNPTTPHESTNTNTTSITQDNSKLTREPVTTIPKNVKRTRVINPQIQKQIEDDANDAQKLLEDNKTHIEQEEKEEQEREHRGFIDGFKVEQQNIDLQSNLKTHRDN